MGKRFIRDIAMCLGILILLASCSRKGLQTDAAPTSGGAPPATPVAATLAPTPEPERTTLEVAFLNTQGYLRDLPAAGDPSAIFPNSNQVLIGPRPLREATPNDLEWAWREIAMRKGRKPFKSYDFEDRAWYELDENFSSENLTQIEAENIINIRTTAMEHYGNMTKVRNAKLSVDLSGDGAKETVAFTVDRFSNKGFLQIGNQRFDIEYPQLDNKLYLCDIDRSDDKRELAIPFTRPGNDYRIAFFSWDGEQLTLLGEVQGSHDTLRLYGDGTLAAYAADDAPCLWRYRKVYALENDLLRPQPIGLRPMLLPATLLRPLELLDENNSPLTFDEGAAVVLMSITPQNECLIYEPTTQRMGYAPVDGQTIGGIQIETLMHGLPWFMP